MVIGCRIRWSQEGRGASLIKIQKDNLTLIWWMRMWGWLKKKKRKWATLWPLKLLNIKTNSTHRFLPLVLAYLVSTTLTGSQSYTSRSQIKWWRTGQSRIIKLKLTIWFRELIELWLKTNLIITRIETWQYWTNTEWKLFIKNLWMTWLWSKRNCRRSEAIL